jgi:hypothetical protein
MSEAPLYLVHEAFQSVDQLIQFLATEKTRRLPNRTVEYAHSSKVKLPHAINFRNPFSANSVTRRPNVVT